MEEFEFMETIFWVGVVIGVVCGIGMIYSLERYIKENIEIE